jgi:ABC-type transport system involved in multi-copper enzyme maturation permease subunit
VSEFDKLRVVIGYEFLKHIRRRRLYVIMAIALVAEALALILVPTLLTGGFPDNVMLMAAILTIGASLAALGSVFFAGDSIAGEYESKTGFILFTNPIKKITLWTGKYLACLLAVALLIIFTYLVIAISLAAIYHQVPTQIFGSLGLCLLYAAAVLSLTFLFSSISKGSMGATVMTLLFIWIISNIVESILALTNNPYWFMISSGGDSITLPYGSLRELIQGLGLGGGNGPFGGNVGSFGTLTIPMAIWGMLIYLVGGFVGSILISRRRQLA